VRITPESREAFMRATLENAEHSRREPGILRFDVLEDRDDPTRFLLVEVYRDAPAQAAHKETAHYARWRDAVAGMMAEPRSPHRYLNRSPDDEQW
jgi:(4S)-4-hydroxy-5-phosphonooxypentane-2,3-dione isomerase